MIKSIYIQDEYFEIWQKFEEINKRKRESQSRVINELIKQYVEEEVEGVKVND